VTPERITRWQGIYYVVSGAWPLLHFPSFEAVTGPKRDRWLVRTVGLLAAVIGLTLVRHPRRSGEQGDLAAAAFAVADLHALGSGQRLTFLADVAVEIGIVGARRAARYRRDVSNEPT
jgi:hypothetical protein